MVNTVFLEGGWLFKIVPKLEKYFLKHVQLAKKNMEDIFLGASHMLIF